MNILKVININILFILTPLTTNYFTTWSSDAVCSIFISCTRNINYFLKFNPCFYNKILKREEF